MEADWEEWGNEVGSRHERDPGKEKYWGKSEKESFEKVFEKLNVAVRNLCEYENIREKKIIFCDLWVQGLLQKYWKETQSNEKSKFFEELEEAKINMVKENYE